MHKSLALCNAMNAAEQFERSSKKQQQPLSSRNIRVTERALMRENLPMRKPITVVPEDPPRVIFMGDVHGDIEAFATSCRWLIWLMSKATGAQVGTQRD